MLDAGGSSGVSNGLRVHVQVERACCWEIHVFAIVNRPCALAGFITYYFYWMKQAEALYMGAILMHVTLYRVYYGSNDCNIVEFWTSESCSRDPRDPAPRVQK